MCDVIAAHPQHSFEASPVQLSDDGESRDATSERLKQHAPCARIEVGEHRVTVVRTNAVEQGVGMRSVAPGVQRRNRRVRVEAQVWRAERRWFTLVCRKVSELPADINSPAMHPRSHAHV